MKFLSRIRILPVLAVIAALAFGVRFGDFVKQVTTLPQAYAEDAPAQNMLDAVQAEGATEKDGQEDAQPTELAQLETSETPSSEKMSDEKIDWRDSQDTDFEYSDVQMELFEDLAQRRKDLDKRAREIAMREALIKAAQQEMEQKFKELTSLRSEIEELLVEQSEEEKARIASLVKIYEGMKAKDAARIFNTLDLDVLIQVIKQMSERKSAPVIAAMNPERARTVTVMLSEQKQLPNLSRDFLN